MRKIEVTLNVASYIAHPFWPEREQVVNILKTSGYNRVRSEDKREQSLRRWLEKNGLRWEDWEVLKKKAERQWYRANGDESGAIIIPRHQLSGALVQACRTAPAGARFNEDQFRSLVQLSDFTTEKTTADTVFRRFVMPKTGKGAPLSNQRALRENEVIENFPAVGTLTFIDDDVKQKAVLDLLRYAGKYVGVGASRKMGYGRFTIEN